MKKTLNLTPNLMLDFIKVRGYSLTKASREAIEKICWGQTTTKLQGHEGVPSCIVKNQVDEDNPNRSFKIVAYQIKKGKDEDTWRLQLTVNDEDEFNLHQGNIYYDFFILKDKKKGK